VAALSALTAVVTVWDQHYNHGGLWTQRTMTLAKIQNLRRRTEHDLGMGLDPQQKSALARAALLELNEILGTEVSTWSDLERK